MSRVFSYITPITYGLIVLIWLYILVFFTKKIKYNQEHNKLQKLLLYILIINAIGTILSNLYFGIRQSSHDGIFPIELFNVLTKPQYVFLPKFLILIAGILIFFIVLYKWLPTEKKQNKAIRELINKKNSELLLKNHELRKARDRAEESDKLKTAFLNNMSHEIRTPMNGIVGFSEMLNSPDISSEERVYFSKIIQNSSYQLLRIIDDILEIANLQTKQEELKEVEFSLNDFLMELYSIFNLKNIETDLTFTLKKGLRDSESYIISDKVKINKIISNLIENAFRYTEKGFIEVGYNITDNNLVLYVKDTGIGISPENHKIVFERFSQEEKDISRKYGGLGLGLSISKENAILLGGDITLESKKGKGSTFYVTIPYKPVSVSPGKPSIDYLNSESFLDKEDFTVLVAEDEDMNYLYIETILRENKGISYSLLHAKNGKEAVEMCKHNNHVDIVLMDIKMPVMNGHEATEIIKSEFPDLPIIAQTAYSTESDKQQAFKYGCNDFITKPINKDELFMLIKKNLEIK